LKGIKHLKRHPKEIILLNQLMYLLDLEILKKEAVDLEIEVQAPVKKIKRKMIE
jgi:hypothetical protein